MEDVRRARFGTRAAIVGSVLGIVPAVALGILRFALSEEPEAYPQLAGHIAFTLVYLAPYALVIIAVAAPNPGGSWRSPVGSWVALFCRELLGLLAGNLGIFACHYRDLIRRDQKSDCGAPPAGNRLAGRGRGTVDRRYGGLRFLYAPVGAGPGASVLGPGQRSRRTTPLGVPSRPHHPRRIQHLPRPWWHSGLLQRYHHQYRGRHQHGSPCGRLLDDAVGCKIPQG